MPKNSLNVSLKGADDIFSTEESRQEQQREQVQQIPIGELFLFKNHPFKVLDDESMQRTVESVEQYGVLSPLIARPRPEGGYEIISGHRRQHAAQLAGLETLPVIVRNMDDDAAVLLMVVKLRLVAATRKILQNSNLPSVRNIRKLPGKTAKRNVLLCVKLLKLTRKQQQSTKHSYRKTGNAAANMPKRKSWLNGSLLIQSPFNLNHLKK